MSHRQSPKSDLTGATERPGHKLPSEHTKDEAGVCEAYPGIIESSDIDPLHHERMKDELSATSKAKGGQESNPGLLATAADMAAGAARYAYSAAMGNQVTKEAGKENMLGSSK